MMFLKICLAALKMICATVNDDVAISVVNLSNGDKQVFMDFLVSIIIHSEICATLQSCACAKNWISI